jgi:hypothetical protein
VITLERPQPCLSGQTALETNQSGESRAQSVSTLPGVLGEHWLFFQALASEQVIGEQLELTWEEMGLISRLNVGEAILVMTDQ